MCQLKGRRDSHIDVLNGVPSILTDDVRERKALCRALLQTVDGHGLSLGRTNGVEGAFHVHSPGASVEGEEGGVWVEAGVQEAGVLDETDRADEGDESCTCEDDGSGRVCRCQQGEPLHIGDARSDRRQRIQDPCRSVNK